MNTGKSTGPVAADDGFEAAWNRHVQERWDGWTRFAAMHTQASGASEKAGFRAAFDEAKRTAAKPGR